MRNNYTEDGRVWLDDHICEMADMMLGIEGLRYIYLKKHDRTWIRKLGDDGMKFAVMSMTEVQLRIIELLIFEDRTVRIKIRDKGCGIENIEKAMEPMFTTSHDEERAGLGFAVMQSFMDKVNVRSKTGKGTTVTLEKRLSCRVGNG